VSWNQIVPSVSELHSAKRRAVLREAAQAFNRQGYHATTLEGVAKRLGITKTAIYHYFPNKNALLKACFDDVMDAAFANLAEATANGRNGREKLRRVFAGYLTHLLDALTVAVVVLEGRRARAGGSARRLRQARSLRTRAARAGRGGHLGWQHRSLRSEAGHHGAAGAVNWVPRWLPAGRRMVRRATGDGHVGVA
jgi:TetR/AcrR family transcriptional regulator